MATENIEFVTQPLTEITALPINTTTRPNVQQEQGVSEHWLVFTRTSAFYDKYQELWTKATAAYNGGRDYIKSTLKKHPSETDEEYTERINNSYNINLIKYSTSRFGDYIFSKAPRRTGADPELLIDFDRKQKHINSVMREVFDYRTIYALTWVLVDMPVLDGNVVDIVTKKAKKIRPYCRAVSPLSIPDWDFDEFGGLNWIILEEFLVKKANPNTIPVKIKRRTLYTKTFWQVFECEIGSEFTRKDSAGKITASEVHPNTLGIVPAIPYTNLLFNEFFNHPPIDDILTINDAVLAGESELLTNILKQTYGQLILPASTNALVAKIKSQLAEEDPEIDLNAPTVTAYITKQVNIVLSRTKAIMEDTEEKGTARYIQPSGATTESIINHDDRLVNMLMRLYGFLVGVHTTQKESAESKSVDNISLAAQLRSISAALEELENRIWVIFGMFEDKIKIPKVKYNSNFDIHELKSVIASITELANFNCGEEFGKQLQRAVANVLNSIDYIDDDTYEKIMEDIKSGLKMSKPVTFEDPKIAALDASGTKPDSMRAKSDYDKSSIGGVSKTQKM